MFPELLELVGFVLQAALLEDTTEFIGGVGFRGVLYRFWARWEVMGLTA